MNGQPLFRFQLSEKNRIQDAGVRKPTTEQVKNSQVYSIESKQMSSQRSLSVQLQQNESEHMGTLHARLHQEADKIRKWKIQTELDLKDKVKKLTEASLQIDIMKKSLLELQLENERTSARLQEEIGSREDVLRRINGTRELCSLLQLHASKVDDRLTKCETERTELKYVGKENMQLIEEVTKQLHNLQLAASESNKKIQSQATVERNERIQAEKAMKTRIDDMDQEVQLLKTTLKEKDTELCDLLVILQEKNGNIQAMEKTKDDLQKKVAGLYEELVSKEEELKESSLRISTVQNDRCRLETTMKVLEHEFNSLQIAKDSITLDMTEAVSRLEKHLQQAKQEVESTKTLLEEEQHKLKACKNKLAETSILVENLKLTGDSLMMEKTDVEMQLDLQKFQMSNLMAENAEDKDEIHWLNGEIVILTKKLDHENLCRMHAQDEIDTLQTRISTLMLETDDHIEEIVVLEDQLSASQEKMKSLESLLSEEEHKTIKLQSDINKLEQRIACDREHQQQVEDQIDDMRQEMYKKDTVIREKDEVIDKLKNDLKTLKSDTEEKENELKASNIELQFLRSQMSKQDDMIQDLTSQLNDLAEEKKENGKSWTTQQKKVTATMKQNNDLKKEIKCMKTVLEKEKELVQERDVELINIQEELENLKKVKDAAEQSLLQYEEEVNKIKQLCRQDQEASRLAIKKGEEMQESAQKEKQYSLALTDRQLTEMMATLDTYKQNNEKLISEKDAEIQTLRTKLENSESLAAKRDRELSAGKKEIEHLKIQVASKITEKSHESAEKVNVISERQSPRTPAPTTPMKTPQNSILRTWNLVSASKRRKVAFVPSDGSKHSSSEESDLMEFNIEHAVSNKVSTPLLTKVSPKVRGSENLCTATPKSTPRRISMSRICTGTPHKQMVPDVSTVKKKGASVKENIHEAQRKCVDPRPKIINEGKTANVRKTPAKKMSKIFTTSPRSKTPSSKSKIKEKTKPGQMSWFELDSVYGFGPED